MSWNSMLGHQAAVASLQAAWKNGRLAHAYLFVGPKGIGKHTFARELAKALLCETPRQKLEACDNCSACKLVAAETHPDLFMVARPEDKQEFTIDVIRGDPDDSSKPPGLLEQLALKPSRGGKKIAILDDADDLNAAAANCFLKTLEEPPPASFLILIGGTDAERQLPTIVSRCQVIRFAPLPPALVRQLLNEHGITDSLRQNRLLQLADGSPGQALALNDEEVWAFRQQLLETLGQGKINAAETAKQWMEFIENAGKEAAAHRQRASLIFRLLIVALETALKLSIGAAISGMDPAEEQILRRAGERLGEEKLLSWIERALEADRQIDRKVQLILVVEAFADAICR